MKFDISQIMKNQIIRSDETANQTKNFLNGFSGQEKTSEVSFLDYLKNSVSEVNESQKNADKMAANVATGKTENIHETMLALSQAEVEFKMMVQVRNKALEAYQEVMRMQV